VIQVTPDEIRAAMEDPVAQRLLASANPARLAYVARDRTPRVVPVGFHWNVTTIVIGTVPASAKVKALKANPGSGHHPRHESADVAVELAPGPWHGHGDSRRRRLPEYVAGARKLTPAQEFAN
jgi:hypothetical protein